VPSSVNNRASCPPPGPDQDGTKQAAEAAGRRSQPLVEGIRPLHAGHAEASGHGATRAGRPHAAASGRAEQWAMLLDDAPSSSAAPAPAVAPVAPRTSEVTHLTSHAAHWLSFPARIVCDAHAVRIAGVGCSLCSDPQHAHHDSHCAASAGAQASRGVLCSGTVWLGGPLVPRCAGAAAAAACAASPDALGSVLDIFSAAGVPGRAAESAGMLLSLQPAQEGLSC
jgi:hypothetical protein